MEESLEKKLLEDIKKTGFALELQVASILKKRGWSVNSGEAYEDFDQNKSREIDIISIKGSYSDKYKFRFGVHLIIEIKKSSKRPWIIFTSPIPEYRETVGWSILHTSRNTTNTESTIFWRDSIEQGFPRYKKDRIGSAFHEGFKNPNDPSKIFEAVMSSCKAAIYKKQQFHEPPFQSDFEPDKEKTLDFYLPIVIFQGDLFEAYLDDKGELTVSRDNYIPCIFNYSSPNYREEYNYDPSYYPDIVSFDYLEEYLEEMEKWIGILKTNLINDLKKEID